MNERMLRPGERQRALAKTRTWNDFEEAARAALAAGNEISLLQHTLKKQHERVEEAKDTLWVRLG